MQAGTSFPIVASGNSTMSRPATRVSRQLWMGQRRHGSNVPGPLEAGRRLNKRRRTNLASGGFRDTVEPALLFGAGFPKSEPAGMAIPSLGAIGVLKLEI
jgi:hypothetical protein